MKVNTKKLEVAEAISFFTNLKDWPKRLLVISGLLLGMSIATYPIILVASIFLIIPIIGFFIFFGIYLALIAVYFAGSLYFNGYKLDLIKAIQAKEEVESVEILADLPERVRNGWRLFLANLLYNLPAIFLMICAGAFLFLATFILNSKNSSAEALYFIAILCFFFVSLLVSLYQLCVTVFARPVFHALLLKEQHKPVWEVVKPERVWNLINLNIKTLLWILLINLGVFLVAAVGIFFSVLTWIFCIGILLFLAIYIFLIPYFLHLDAYNISFIELDKNGKA